MEVLVLIEHARAAGLVVAVEGEQLVVEGPVSAAPLAHALGRHKAAVLAALSGTLIAPTITETSTNAGKSEGFGFGRAQKSPENDLEALFEIDCPPPCPKCGSLELWQTVTGIWRCLACDPPNMATAQRITRLAARYRRRSPPLADGESIARESEPDRPRSKRAPKSSRCSCNKAHRQVTDELAEPGWLKVMCNDCGQWVGLRPTPRTEVNHVA